MRNLSLWPIIAILFGVSILAVGCINNDIYANPTSPPASTTEWRSMTVDSAGGTFDFPDIGATLIFPADAIPADETYTLRIRLFPPGVPMLPTGRVYIRLGTFELEGPTGVSFDESVEVHFRLAKAKTSGTMCKGFVIDPEMNEWFYSQNAPIINNGTRAKMQITQPGIYGGFEPIPLNVSATASRQMGPAPLSIGLKAIVTGGHPPYQIFWDFSDNSDGKAGEVVAHMYKDPAVYTPSVTVIDDDGNQATNWLTITVLAIAGPANGP